MQCEQFRDRIAVDPAAALDEHSASHEQQCPACAAYARRIRESERRIASALRFDVERMHRPIVAAAAGMQLATMRVWAIAASVLVAGVAVWLGMRFVPTDDPVALAREVEAHWRHEPESWVRTSTPVAATVLETVLGDGVRVDRGRLSVVSYARSCLINGRWVPHLVVQGEAGPVMVLLMAREPLSQALPLDIPEEGLRGAILPLEQGSIAILGHDDESFETVERSVAEAVDWSI